MTDEGLNRFAQSLAADMADAMADPEATSPFSGEVFTQLILDGLEDAGQFDGIAALHQEGYVGRASYRIDGFAFDEERERLDLFTTIYHGDASIESVPNSDAVRAFERAQRFASAAVEGLADNLEPSNTDASDLARRIQAQASRIAVLRIVLLSDGALVGSLPKPADWEGRRVEYDAYDLVRLHRVLGVGETRSDIAVDFVALTGKPLECLHVPSGDGVYEAYLAVLPGEALSRVYEKYGLRLLELNVRAFLGVQGRKSVNAELRKTIVEAPSMFLAYNNGIVATADSIEIERGPSGRDGIRSLRGLQIVNGGQTTASLHRARRKDHNKLAGVEVPIKIIHVTGADLSEMVSAVSRAANRQNTVQLADFSSNDPFHHEIETIANNSWLDGGRGRWFYERARGAYVAEEQKASYRKSDQQIFRSQTPKARRINKLDMARYLTAWAGEPNRVCLGGQKNFQFFMQRMKDNPPPAPTEQWFHRLVAIAILYRSAERIARIMKLPAYRSQIVAYLIASLSQRTGGRLDFEAVWKMQAISSDLEDLIRKWIPKIDQELRRSAGAHNPGEWFKKEDCWSQLRERLPTLDDPLPYELTRMSGGHAVIDAPAVGVSIEDYDRIALAMAVNSNRWLTAAEKGQQAGVLHWKVAGICRTMASYAAGGWVRKPSPKQAKHALHALDQVEKAGVLGSPSAEAEAVE